MNNRILVAYASKRGATAEIAARIAATIEARNLRVDLCEVDDVTSVDAYSTVVLGSAVYIGRWQKEAVHFLEKNADALAAKEVWIFSSGPTGEGDPVEQMDGWTLPEKLKPVVEEIDPREVTIFHGKLDPDVLNVMERWVIKNIKAPVGDFRDWEAIEAWAVRIAESQAAQVR